MGLKTTAFTAFMPNKHLRYTHMFSTSSQGRPRQLHDDRNPCNRKAGCSCRRGVARQFYDSGAARLSVWCIDLSPLCDGRQHSRDVKLLILFIKLQNAHLSFMFDKLAVACTEKIIYYMQAMIEDTVNKYLVRVWSFSWNQVIIN